MFTTKAIADLERVWALDLVDFVKTLQGLDPSWQSEAFPLADGFGVLSGAGLYVNRALGLGLKSAVSPEHFDQLEERAAAVGVNAGVELVTGADWSLRNLLDTRGYKPSHRNSALVRRLTKDGGPIASSSRSYLSEIEVSHAAHEVELWQEISATAWGHESALARRASDAFSQVAAIREPGFVIARSRSDGRPLGCASMAVRGPVATLGGMSTLPDERRQGVQVALIGHRLELAARLGCDMAVTTAMPGGASERNLIRSGFGVVYTKVIFEQL